MSVTVTQELTQQTVTVTGNPVENNVTVTVSNARGSSGAAGAAGPNSVTSATTTNLTGFISGNGTTIAGATAATDAATANTLVRRDANGGAIFGDVQTSIITASGILTTGQVEFNGTDAGDSLTFNVVNYTYGTGAASAHRIALGAGTTGATLFGAADAGAARAALGIQTKTGTSTGLAAVGVTDITGLTGYDLEANTWYKLELQYLWTSTSSNFQINFVTTGTFLRGATTPAIGHANSGAAVVSQSVFINDTSFQLRGNVGDSRTNIPAFGYAYFRTGTAGTGKVQLQLLAGTTLSTIGSSCAVLTKQN